MASAVASGRSKYSRVTTGPATMISPIVPSLTSRSSDQVGSGRSSIPMIRTSMPSTGRPRSASAPVVATVVSSRISVLPIEAIGKASVAP